MGVPGCQGYQGRQAKAPPASGGRRGWLYLWIVLETLPISWYYGHIGAGRPGKDGIIAVLRGMGHAGGSGWVVDAMKRQGRRKILFILAIVVVPLLITVTYQQTRYIDSPYGLHYLGERVPKDILHKMTTKALVETALNAPDAFDIWLSNDLQTGFESSLSDSTLLQELFARADASTAIMEVYFNTEVVLDAQRFIAQNVDQVTYLEVMLTQESIRNKLTDQDRERLDHKISENYSIRASHPEVFSRGFCAYAVQQYIARKGVDVKYPYEMPESAIIEI